MVAYPGPACTADTTSTTGIAASIGACYIAIDTAAICNTTVAYAVDIPCAYGSRIPTQHPSRTAYVRPFSFSFI